MKCSFCGATIRTNEGKMFVKYTGEMLYFCRAKCEKNYFMKREPKKLKWIRKK